MFKIKLFIASALEVIAVISVLVMVLGIGFVAWSTFQLARANQKTCEITRLFCDLPDLRPGRLS
jgi:hypothetical protein